MSMASPSLLALLGLVAFAGFQNRSRISDMLADARESTRADAPAVPLGPSLESREDPGAAGGFLPDIVRVFQGGSTGGALSGGLGDLVARFKSSGWGRSVNSWVETGPNLPMEASDLRSVIGDETLEELSVRTGMSPEQLLLRLNFALPQVVDQLTPAGRIPTQVEALSMI